MGNADFVAFKRWAATRLVLRWRCVSSTMNEQKPDRAYTQTGVELAILEKSARRCCFCFALNFDHAEKRGQLAHLDHDRSNSSESNLAWLCLDHHSSYDSQSSQHKGYTIHEAKSFKRDLEEFIGGKRAQRDAVYHELFERDSEQAKAVDRRTLADLQTQLPGHLFQCLRRELFTDEFELHGEKALFRFLNEMGGPEHEFLDPALEDLHENLRSEAYLFLASIAVHTDFVEVPGGDYKADLQIMRLKIATKHCATTPDEMRADLRGRVVAMCDAYEQLIKKARRKLTV